MGLPRDVATHIEVEGFTSSMSTCSSFTPYSNQHQGVNATFAQGCGEPCGSLAGFPWPRECSSISITLLLPSQETARSVNESPNTPPITLGYQRRALDPSKKACDTHCYCFCYNFAPKREISGDGGTLSPRFPWDFEHAQNLTVEKGASLRYGMLWYSTSPGCRSGCHHELCSTVSRLPDAGSALIEDLANAQLFTVKISN